MTCPFCASERSCCNNYGHRCSSEIPQCPAGSCVKRAVCWYKKKRLSEVFTGENPTIFLQVLLHILLWELLLQWEQPCFAQQLFPHPWLLPPSIPTICPSLSMAWPEILFIQNLSTLKKTPKCLQIPSSQISQQSHEVLWDFGTSAT